MEKKNPSERPRRRKLRVTPEQVFGILREMTPPLVKGLHPILVKKFGKEAPSPSTIKAWCQRYHWVSRIRKLQFDEGKLAVVDKPSNPFRPVDVDKFVAMNELRTIAANITAAIKEATSPHPMSEECKRVLAESNSIVRLGELAIKCVEAVEELQFSVNERRAKENATSAEENMGATNDYVYTAQKRLAELEKQGVKVN